MTHLIDSDVLIDAMGAQPLALAALAVVAEFGLRTSIITLGELYDGVSRHADPLHRRHDVEIFLRPFAVINLEVSMMLRFGQIRAHLRRTGNLIGDLDILIAATAIEENILLITRNRRHFECIPDLGFVTPEDVLSG